MKKTVTNRLKDMPLRLLLIACTFLIAHNSALPVISKPIGYLELHNANHLLLPTEECEKNILIDDFRQSLKNEDWPTINQYVYSDNLLSIIFEQGLLCSALWLIVPSPHDTEEQHSYRKNLAKKFIADDRAWNTESLSIMVLLLDHPGVQSLLKGEIDDVSLLCMHNVHSRRLSLLTSESLSESDSEDCESSETSDDGLDLIRAQAHACSRDLNAPQMHTPEQIQEFYTKLCDDAIEKGATPELLNTYVWTIAQPTSTQETVMILHHDYQPKNDSDVELIRHFIGKQYFKDAVVSDHSKSVFYSAQEQRTFSIRLFRKTEEL